MFRTDVQAMGLRTAQGLLLTEAFYWDLNESTRAWSRRFVARDGGRMPTMNHAGVYSETLAYLKSAAASGSISGRTVVAAMGAAPIDDKLFGPTVVRPDGRAVHAMYLFQVKAPDQSTGPYDLCKVLAVIPPAEAFRPLDQGGCPAVSR